MKPKFKIGELVKLKYLENIFGTIKKIDTKIFDVSTLNSKEEIYENYYLVAWDWGTKSWYPEDNLTLYNEFVYHNDFLERVEDRMS